MSQPEQLATGASYYLPPGVTSAVISDALDIPLKEEDEVVTVDFNDNPNAGELITFLENEKAEPYQWAFVASSFAKRGAIEDAVEVVKQASGILPHSDVFASYVSWFYIKLAKASKVESERFANFETAGQFIQKALELNKDNGLARLASAEIFYYNRAYDQAFDAYERLIKRDSDKVVSIYASIGKAKVLFQRKSFNLSLKQFQAVLIERPLIRPDPRLGIGLNFWKLKDKKLAIQSWKRALEIDPENESARLLLLLSKFDSSFNSLTDEEFVQTYSVALESLNELALNVGSDNPVLLLLITSYYYSKGDYDAVLKIAQKVLTISSSSQNLISDAQFWIARVYYNKGDYINAQKHFTESLKANEDNLLSKLGVGQSQIKRESIEESIITFENIYSKTQKILEVNYILGILYSYNTKTYPKAIELLEKYVRASSDSNEQLFVNSYLTLSKLYENKDNTKALDYLSKTIELIKTQEEDVIPVEVLNNLGVFHFIKGNAESAQTFFQSALDLNKREDLGITLLYNNARAKENTDLEYSKSTYKDILAKTPSYINAKLRLLFSEIVESVPVEEISNELEQLLSTNPSNSEIRAFYSWFLKKSAKSNSNQNLESSHNKETLVKYDSHDTYALISLGNLYCAIARAIKGNNPKDIEKRNQSYIRGAQLLQKVLSIDPQNIFAAQGIAIIFVENGQNSAALEIFRKIRDSIDDNSVYINLGHCLIEVGQYSKAIESYEIALRRYGDAEKDSHILTLIGKAWFLRGIYEKSIESFNKALEYSEKSLIVAENNQYEKLIPSLKYNVAFVKFNIAQFSLKQKFEQRTVQELEKIYSDLELAIKEFEELSELKNSPIPANILKQRASMGTNTLLKQLERSINEQKEYEVNYQSKIEEAQRLREIEKQKAALEAQRRIEEEEKLEFSKREEYLKLQEQAREWEKERESYIVNDDGEKKKRKGKKNAILTDDEELSQDEDGNVKTSKKGGKRKKKTGLTADEKNAKKRKVDQSKFKSTEFVNDSDDDSDDEMFDEGVSDNGDEEEDALEAAEAKISAQEKGEKEPEEEDEAEAKDDENDEDGLF